MNSQKENALQKISELQKTIVMIEAAQGTIQSALSEVLNQDIFFKELPERYIITKKLGDKIDEQELLIDFTDFQNIIAKNKLIDTYETGYFYTTNENFEFRPVQIFNTVVIGTSSDTSIVSTIPAGKYLCICFNRQNTQEQLSKLNSYLKHNNINCSTVLQIELLDNVFEANNPFFELQLNIKER